MPDTFETLIKAYFCGAALLLMSTVLPLVGYYYLQSYIDKSCVTECVESAVSIGDFIVIDAEGVLQ